MAHTSLLDAAAVQGVALSGERAGQRDVRVGRGTRDEPFVVAPLCADLDGFSLHGAVRVAAGDRKRVVSINSIALPEKQLRQRLRSR